MPSPEIKTVGKFAATFGGLTIAGAEIMSGVSLAQTTSPSPETGADCASPSPVASLVIESPSPMPSLKAVVPSPSGIDVFIASPSPIPSPDASPLASPNQIDNNLNNEITNIDADGDGDIDEFDKLITETNPDCIVPVNLEDYSLDMLYAKNYEPLAKDTKTAKKKYFAAIERNAPAILEFTRAYPELGTLDKVINYYKEIYKFASEGNTLNDGGANIASNIVLALEKSHMFASLYNSSLKKASNDEDKLNSLSQLRIANAYKDMAYTLRALSFVLIDFDSNNPKLKDKKMDGIIKYQDSILN